MKKSKDGFDAWRPDRVFVGGQGEWEAVDISLVGQQNLPYYEGKEVDQFEITTPSDHLGLVTKY